LLATRGSELTADELAEIVSYQTETVQQSKVATGFLDDWEHRFPTDSRAAWARVTIARSLGRWPQASQAAYRAVARWPAESGGLYRAAELEAEYCSRHARPGHEQSASLRRLHDYLQALGRMRPDSRGWACTRMAKALTATEHLTEAMRYLEQGEHSGPNGDVDRADAWLDAAELAARKGQDALRKRCAEAVLEIDPNNTRAQELAGAAGTTRQ
jgi:tetratricopeptide (TPR) repeat protein